MIGPSLEQGWHGGDSVCGFVIPAARAVKWVLMAPAHLPLQVDPPAGWEWESGWQVDHGPATDQDGWAYAPGGRAVPVGQSAAGKAYLLRALLWPLCHLC